MQEQDGHFEIIHYVFACERESLAIVRALTNFIVNFTKPFVDYKDIELNVIKISNSQVEESKELYKVFYGLKEPESIENLAFDKITEKKMKKHLQFVRVDDDGETILIKHLIE